ncbi:sensor histidine kinase [Sciscionella marina]|uniref:sensor histidine kinase n=1 Tax=Sciscionella marina TaxID=508770 RepID=UPI00037063DB|nr:histidine kinase [Sciscionella marina]
MNAAVLAVRLVVLGAIGFALGFEPGFGLHGVQALTLAGFVLAVFGWIGTALLADDRFRPKVALHAVFVVGGLLIVPGTMQTALGLILVCVALLSTATGVREPYALGITIAAGIVVALLYGLLVGPVIGLVWILPAVGSYLAGTTRRQRQERLEQAELLLAETQVAREREAQAATAEERARIAREMHDVLAHSIGAVSVQLEAADALLEDVPGTERALDCLRRARGLAAEGLTETRRAVGALRGDPGALRGVLTGLADGYQGAAHLELPETVPALRPEAALAIGRIATEAVTNAGKHSGGAPLWMTLNSADGELCLWVHNELDPAAEPGSGGFGLIGMRERAERIGGTVTAGAEETGWTVRVRVPHD